MAQASGLLLACCWPAAGLLLTWFGLGEENDLGPNSLQVYDYIGPEPVTLSHGVKQKRKKAGRMMLLPMCLSSEWVATSRCCTSPTPCPDRSDREVHQQKREGTAWLRWNKTSGRGCYATLHPLPSPIRLTCNMKFQIRTLDFQVGGGAVLYAQ